MRGKEFFCKLKHTIPQQNWVPNLQQTIANSLKYYNVGTWDSHLDRLQDSGNREWLTEGRATIADVAKKDR